MNGLRIWPLALNLSFFLLNLSHSGLAKPLERGEPPKNVVAEWNSAALQGVRDSKIGPPMVARALAILHTCIYDAWAAYDQNAIGTQLGSQLRSHPARRTRANKEKATSYAGYRALVDLFPGDRSSVFDPLMITLGYDPQNDTLDPNDPAGIGNLACTAVLDYRHHDGSNQLGDLHPGAYSDYTGFTPVNTWDQVNDQNYWQPLRYPDAQGVFTIQEFLGAQWNRVTPFALTSPDQFRAWIGQYGPAHDGSAEYIAQAEELISISAKLTDEQKVIAEYWKDGPHSETPPGHWNLLAEWVSRRDHHTLDDDVKMFFALNNAIFDASIVAWDAKIYWDSVRPISAIRYLFTGEQIYCWGGPGQGPKWMDGSQWIPYQLETFPTPPFPEYISGHSIFSASAAETLKTFTGGNQFGASTTIKAGSSEIEPGTTPALDVTLSWSTFSKAADQAGMSRRYGGIHFREGDLVSRQVGRLVAKQAWEKSRAYWSGARADEKD